MPPDSAPVNILSIAGSDPSGGAGIQADLKTFSAFGAYGMAAITALTAQNTCGVKGAQVVEPAFIRAQLEAIFDDIQVDGVKIGMLGDEHATQTVLKCLIRYRPRVIVLDPVIVSTSGHRLTSEAAVNLMVDHLAPIASLITPNIPEAEAMMRRAVLDPQQDVISLSQRLSGVPVLLKGGHSKGDLCTDYLCDQGGAVQRFDTRRLDSRNTHGTGCTLSSALTCLLAQGVPLPDAVRRAKAYITTAIQSAARLNVGTGAGHGPLDHSTTPSGGADA